MRMIKCYIICLITATVCFVSCSKQELQNEGETSCIKSDFPLQPSGNETYPLLLPPADYPFQYAINQSDIDDFFNIVHQYLTFVNQNGCVVMSMDTNGSLLRYGVYDEFFDMEQVIGDTVYVDEGEGYMKPVAVCVGSICSPNYNEIKAWMHQKMAEGCWLEMGYNRTTSEYIVFAYIIVEAEETEEGD